MFWRGLVIYGFPSFLEEESRTQAKGTAVFKSAKRLVSTGAFRPARPAIGEAPPVIAGCTKGAQSKSPQILDESRYGRIPASRPKHDADLFIRRQSRSGQIVRTDESDGFLGSRGDEDFGVECRIDANDRSSA
jgi:hypothetical protein